MWHPRSFGEQCHYPNTCLVINISDLVIQHLRFNSLYLAAGLVHIPFTLHLRFDDMFFFIIPI